ncbi:MAG TPA: alpha/beta hydrolase family protein [Anaerolineaceae bacterium]
MTATERSTLRWTPAGLLTVLAVIVLALVVFSLVDQLALWAGILAGAIVLIGGLGGAGIFYQHLAETRDRTCFPAPGRFLDAGGLRLHVQVLGIPRAEPVVIFENGELSASPEWAWVAPEVARFARVVLYDRPGTGWSPTPTVPLTAETLTAALRQALTQLDLAPPYVLVGHGMGGLLSQAFSASHPEGVQALVLVDPLPAELVESSILDGKKPGAPAKLAYQLGLPRLTGRARETAEGLPEEQFDELVAFQNAVRDPESRYAESRLARSAAGLLLEKTPSGPSLPMVVIAASEADARLDASTRAQISILQSNLAGRSARSTYRLISGANRFTITRSYEHAQIIAAEIRELAIRLNKDF